MGKANPFRRPPNISTRADVEQAVAMARENHPGEPLVIHVSRVVFADLAKDGVLIRRPRGGHIAFNHPVKLHEEWTGYICEVRPDDD